MIRVSRDTGSRFELRNEHLEQVELMKIGVRILSNLRGGYSENGTFAFHRCIYVNINANESKFLDVYLEFLNICIIVNIISSTNIRIMIGSNTKCL